MQFYTDPTRENDPHALPDAETFQANTANCPDCGSPECVVDDDAPCGACGRGFARPWNDSRIAWYWWPCFPGCLPDSDPIGPFDSEDAAIADARERAS